MFYEKKKKKERRGKEREREETKERERKGDCFLPSIKSNKNFASNRPPPRGLKKTKTKTFVLQAQNNKEWSCTNFDIFMGKIV